MNDQSDRERPEEGVPGWREGDSAVFIDYGRAFTPERERQHEIIARPGRLGLAAPHRRALPRQRRSRQGPARPPAGNPVAGARRLAGHAGADARDLRRACRPARAPVLRSGRDRLAGAAAGAGCDLLVARHPSSRWCAEQRLFADLLPALRPGGVLVLADLIRPEAARLEDRRRGLAPGGRRALAGALWRRPRAAQVRGAALELFPLARRQRHRSPLLGRGAHRVALRRRFSKRSSCTGCWPATPSSPPASPDPIRARSGRPRPMTRDQPRGPEPRHARRAARRHARHLPGDDARRRGADAARRRRPALEVRLARRPTVSFYRYLYGTIGQAWTWVVRRLMPDEALASILGHPGSRSTSSGRMACRPACRARPARAPRHRARLLRACARVHRPGPRPLAAGWTIRHAWRASPRRLWVHTCDLDHPRALRVYQSPAFRSMTSASSSCCCPRGCGRPSDRGQGLEVTSMKSC